MLRGGGGSFCRGGLGRTHENLIPVLSLVLVANSLPAIFGPSACTRVTLKRPSAQTTVKPSASTATTSPSLPAIPLGSLAGSGLASKIFTVLPSNPVHAPGAGLQQRMSRTIRLRGLAH